jgi:hypothetical protein
MSFRVFSVGDCPVDPGFGVVLVLAMQTTGDFVFFCPACGCAWREPPQGRLDEINSLDEVAPDGVRLATDAELAGLAGKLLEADDEPWESDLAEILSSGS